MPFKFRFARLKSVRELEEDLAKQRLALALLEEQRQVERLNQARLEEDMALHNFSELGSCEVLDLELSSRNCHDMSRKTMVQQGVYEKAVLQVEDDRHELVARMKKAKILQSLYDRHHEAYKAEAALAEQKVLDELGGIQHLRRVQTVRMQLAAQSAYSNE